MSTGDTTPTQQLNIGFIDETNLAGPFTNFSANLNTGNWTFALTNVQWGNTSLGYNGIVTVASSSAYNIMPAPAMDVILTFIGATPISEIPLGGGVVKRTYNISDINFNNLLNLTYYIQDKPFVMTQEQYIFCNGIDCVMYLSEATNVYPYNSAWTIGAAAFNMTYCFFDFDEKVFGVAPLQRT